MVSPSPQPSPPGERERKIPRGEGAELGQRENENGTEHGAMAEQDNISIVRVDKAAVFITDLFRQTFNQSPPPDPTHYVAFAKIGPARFEAVGYYHVTEYGPYGLVGGLCVDPRYRNRGLGEALSRIAFVNHRPEKGPVCLSQ